MINTEIEDGTTWVFDDNTCIGYISVNSDGPSLCFTNSFPIKKQLEVLEYLSKQYGDTNG